MIRKIVLIGKYSGHSEYFCNGSGCDECEFRYQCFTERASTNLDIDWEDIRKRYSCSPTNALRQMTKSKIYVKGSRKYRELQLIK